MSYTQSQLKQQIFCTIARLLLKIFTSLTGTSSQHTLYNEVAPIHRSYMHIDGIASINHLAATSADIGRQYNASGDINNASYIADACWYIAYSLKEVTIGVGEEGVQTVDHTVQMIAHPIETAENIGYGVAWLINGVIAQQQRRVYAFMW